MNRNELKSKKQEIHERNQRERHLFGISMTQEVIVRVIALIVILALIVVAMLLLKPYIGNLFTSDGRAELIRDVKEAGPAGGLVLLVLEVIQVVVAFIPGEVVQMVAGMLYGPWLGGVIIIVGCLLSMWMVYEVVHRLGQPFAESIVSTKYLESFRRFEDSGKLSVVVFILFLIPGLPKDVFTYLVPLTSMPRNEYLLIAMVARTPGILMSTFAASGLMNGDIVQSVIVFAVLGALGIAGILMKNRIIDALHRWRSE